MKRFFRWLANVFSPQEPTSPPDLTQTGAHLRQTGSHPQAYTSPVKQALPDRQPEVVDFDAGAVDVIDDIGPGKNVLIRKYVREETGTHETLTILDDNAIDTEEQFGIDPYNTGNFDRSKNWDKRFRKD